MEGMISICYDYRKFSDFNFVWLAGCPLLSVLAAVLLRNRTQSKLSVTGTFNTNT